jgi:hypothetical protein
MRTALKYGAILIGGYLVLSHFTGAGKVISAAATGATTVTRGLQGR